MSDDNNKWDEKLTERFLTLYRRQKCLWNPYSRDYKNCSVKNKAFETVVNELNVPGIWKSECLQQIEVIRERYKEEQVRIKNGLKTGNNYNSEVQWFNLMSEMLCEVIRDEENFGKNLRMKNFTIDKETVDNYNRSDRFFSEECIWDKDKEKEKLYNKKIQFFNCKDSGVQIETENLIGVCGNKANNNLIVESVNVTEQNKRGDCSVEEKCLLDEKKEEEDYKEMRNCVKCSFEKKKREKCCQKKIEDYDRSKLLPEKKVLRVHREDNNFEKEKKKEFKKKLIDEGTDCEMSKAVPSECYNSCVEKFRNEKSSKFLTGFEEDGYNVCSRFKIVIPSLASEDQNLEITGYEIQVMNHRPELNDSGLEEDLSEDCVCRNKKLSGKVNFSRGQDSTRFSEGSFIKLDINCNRSKEIHGKRRRKLKDEDCKVQNENRINTKTQTEKLRGYDNLIREKDEFNYLTVFFKDQESSTNDSLITNLATRGSTSVRCSDIESTVASREKSAVKNQSMIKTNNNSCCVETKSGNGGEIVQSESLGLGRSERFNNTRMVLNVIVKILQGNESQNNELQKTLDTMLETIDRERISISGLKNVTESSSRKTNHIYNPPTENSFNESTRYQNLPIKLQQGKEIENNVIKNSHQAPLVNDRIEITNSKSESPEIVYQNYNNEIPSLDETLMHFLPGEIIKATSKESNNELSDKPITITGRETQIIEPHDDVLKIPKFSSDTILNYTMNGFEGEEPIASSSRRISEEPRTPNELTREFLDVIKYTIMMDRILENSENAADKNRLNQ